MKRMAILIALLAAVGGWSVQAEESETEIVEGAATADWSGGGRLYAVGHWSDVGQVRLERTVSEDSFFLRVDYDGPLVSVHCTNDNGTVTGTIELRAIQFRQETRDCETVLMGESDASLPLCRQRALAANGQQFVDTYWSFIVIDGIGLCGDE